MKEKGTKMSKILVVDDNAALLDSLSRFFKGRAIFVTTDVCHSVEEAIVAIEQYQPDMVLLDHNLNEEDQKILEGVEVARILHERGFSAVIISHSGKSRKDQAELMLPFGVRHFASKVHMDAINCIQGTCDCAKFMSENKD